MAYRKKIICEYYAVACRKNDQSDDNPDAFFDFRRWIKKANQFLPSEEENTYDDLTYTYYQEEARLDNIWLLEEGVYALKFARLRQTNLPHTATEKNEGEPISLEDNEYIGEEVVGIYNAQENILMLQRNKHSLSPTGIEQYLNLLWGNKEGKKFI
ncbi:DUF6731 family protein [Halobacteroides halobius]|uniref:DUF6731 family protein n=1 Tax=Halobacteroides halobius TaxID=42422 RepID=UPI0002FEA514|nr:DUF6731 family protein [Halobacteroides halobius]